ncbi:MULTISPECIES: glutathione S-transferase family protein [Chelativorans]|jgi:glutathione S-transferase|uniref:Glutathione S-transferase-like protein n=1 Tax=Chelativorans sp. (strain BNC1) TaxID=266779 RepID=Q11I24_CHESB|nr:MULTISPECIES: glutathione S-transferase [Chelativorans]
MKLYDGGRAPNPRRVRIFLAEKGIQVPTVPVDMARREHQGEAITRLNPLQRLPILELDDGTVITESVAICRYFEEQSPEPALFGRDALTRARVEMWQRRIEFGLFIPVSAAFRHLHPAMKGWEVPQVPAWGEASKSKATEFLRFLDGELAGRPFIAGDEFSIADITGFVAVQFMKPARIDVPEELVHARRWYGEMASRPSAGA